MAGQYKFPFFIIIYLWYVTGWQTARFRIPLAGFSGFPSPAHV